MKLAVPYRSAHCNSRLATGLSAPTPHNLTNNLTNVTLYGLAPRPGEASPVMPPFHAVLNDGQTEALPKYLREKVAHKPQWEGIANIVRSARNPAGAPALYPSPGNQGVPAEASHQENRPW